MPPATGAPMMMPSPPAMISENFAKDAIIAWFRGEFAAANAIIDALCNHLTQLEGGKGEGYESVFTAIHRRRMNWIPILQMQKYYSISDVALELRKVVGEKAKGTNDEKRVEELEECLNDKDKDVEVSEEDSTESNENDRSQVVDSDLIKNDLMETQITDVGSQEAQPMLGNIELCLNHQDCEARRAHIKMTKGFVAKESVKGHMVNVVRGLKLYEDVFTDVELSKLTEFVNELRVAGQSGELSGETFIMYNQVQNLKGNKRELIQLGAPIFGQIREEDSDKCQKSHIEPIPALLQGVVDHLIQWNLISENRKPNSCIINFFDEGEYSQPFQKPPHLDQPISTLLLSESTMAFGRTLVCDNDGNYRGPLMLSLEEGSLLVMRGNSADMARHVMCPSPMKRISITFFKVQTDTFDNSSSAIPPMTRAMTLWQPAIPTPYAVPNGTLNGYEAMGMIPKWGVLRSPVVMLSPVRPMVLGPKRVPRGGTGVFLPWTSRKHAKHLPPRAQKGRFLALPSPVETHKAEPTSDPAISVEG